MEWYLLLNLFVIKMHGVYQFMIWFTVSLVAIFFVITTIGNPFVKSFIIALVISIIAVKEEY